jgi:hypothetical protein
MSDERDAVGAAASDAVPAVPIDGPAAERVTVLARARALWCQLVSGLG